MSMFDTPDQTSFFNFNNPAFLGLLSGLGQASAPSRVPMGFGSTLGMAASGLAQGQKQNLEDKLLRLQLQQFQIGLQQQQARANMLPGLFDDGPPQAPMGYPPSGGESNASSGGSGGIANFGQDVTVPQTPPPESSAAPMGVPLPSAALSPSAVPFGPPRARIDAILEGSGISRQQARFMLITDPTGKSLSEAIAAGAKPQVVRSGSVLEQKGVPTYTAPQAGFTIGDTRYDGQGNVVVTGQKAPPTGYELGPNGSLIPTKGGPADRSVIAGNAAARENATRDVQINKPLPPPQTALTKEAIDDATAYFIQTGHMMGTMRDRGSVAAVQNNLARIKPEGVSSADWINGLTNNAISYNSRKLAATQVGKQQALTTVNEDTVNGAIGIMDDLLKKGAASGLPFTKANEALQWFARQTNDPLAANLKNAVGAISNEYARVMTGQTGGSASSDSARNEAASRILLGFKEGTMRSVAGQMQREMKIRSDSYIHAMDQLTGGQYQGVTPKPVTPIDQPAPTAVAPQQPAASDPLSQARDAIAKGADRTAVIQRLRMKGIDPVGL